MINIESKQGRINANEDQVFVFLTDLRNLDPLIPQDRVKNWQSEVSRCSFSAPPAGEINLVIADQEPNKMIKVEPEGNSPFGFKFFIQLKQVGEQDTRFKLTLKADLNVMMRSILKPQLQKGLDQIVDSLSGIQIPMAPE